METISFNLNKKDSSIIIKVNPKIYPLHTIYSASYVFLDKCYIMLDGDPKKEIMVELRLKENSNLELDILAKEFFNELLNYAFYEEQSRKNAPLRNTLLKAALIGNIIEEESENISEQIIENNDEDWSKIEDIDEEDFDDPEGIAIPWEEKYGKPANNEIENVDNRDTMEESFGEKPKKLTPQKDNDKINKLISSSDLKQNKCSKKDSEEKY